VISDSPRVFSFTPKEILKVKEVKKTSYGSSKKAGD
jgi:hypothetical protein